MLIRISLIIAIVAGLAVGVVNFVQVKTVITTTRDTLNTTSNTLVQTEATLRTTQKDLKGTKSELATTKETLKNTEEARDQALAEADVNRKNAAELTSKLDKTTKERNDAQAEVAAWNVLGITVDQVKTVIADLKASKEALDVAVQENQILSTKVTGLANELARFKDPDYRVVLPVGLKGKVIVCDPKWDFVVLDIGENQGVLERGDLLLNREGKLVAKVRVFRVEKDRCIANVVSGWKVGEPMEGDAAIPAP